MDKEQDGPKTGTDAKKSHLGVGCEAFSCRMSVASAYLQLVLVV
jgi:hypothetical protein